MQVACMSWRREISGLLCLHPVSVLPHLRELRGPLERAVRKHVRDHSALLRRWNLSLGFPLFPSHFTYLHSVQLVLRTL